MVTLHWLVLIFLLLVVFYLGRWTGLRDGERATKEKFSLTQERKAPWNRR